MILTLRFGCLSLERMQVDAAMLKRLREERVVSQRELARMAGLTHQTVWRLENGPTEAHPRTVRKLAGALGVEPKVLVDEKEAKG